MQKAFLSLFEEEGHASAGTNGYATLLQGNDVTPLESISQHEIWYRGS